MHKHIILPLFLLFAGAFAPTLIAQNKNISNGNIYEGEPFIAVNPANTRNIVVCWMGLAPTSTTGATIKVRSSFDGGATWSAVKWIPHLQTGHKSADPSMVFDTDGTLYLCYIDWAEVPISGGVYVCKSVDGGLNWAPPVEALSVFADGQKLPLDRPWMVIDRSNGPLHGALYLTTKPAPWILPPNRPYFTHSTNGGQTWSPWRYADAPGWLVGNLIQQPMAAPDVDANGVFHCIYPSYLPAQSPYPRYLMASTADGGGSFSYKVVNGQVTTPVTDTLPKVGYLLRADPANANHLAFFHLSAAAGDADVVFTETLNGGTTWTPPARVNDDPPGNGKMQDLVWADFDNDGDLIVAWRDRRNAPGVGFANPSEIYAAHRAKGASAFSANFALTDGMTPYHTILKESGNDFMCIELVNDTLCAVWGDVRDGSLDIWFQRTDVQSGASSGVVSLNNSLDARISPNPVVAGAAFQVIMPAPETGELRLFDTSGRQWLHQFFTQTSSVDVATDGLAHGAYFVEIRVAGKGFWGKVVVEKGD